MADGFLGRWARRKEAVRKGEPVEAQPAKAVAPPLPEPQAPEAATSAGQPPAAAGDGGGGERRPPPTLEDVQALTPASDFSRFVGPDVTPQVKNAAMKKLFSDPRFNVMDGLDVYIDDYGRPDPMPPGMLRQLASARFLKLFADEEKKEEAEKDPVLREGADDPPSRSVAQSGPAADQAVPPAENHADPDLRLQQDHAPGPEVPGQGTG